MNIDTNRAEARRLVDELHAAAGRAHGAMRDLLERAAVDIDGYQAGLMLAEPHPLTGYRLVSTAERREAA